MHKNRREIFPKQIAINSKKISKRISIMNKIKKAFMLVFSSLFLASCGFTVGISNSNSVSDESSLISLESPSLSDNSSESITTSNSEVSSSSETPSISEEPKLTDEEIYEGLFNHTNDVKLSLKISKDAIVALNDYGYDPSITTYFDIYWPADLTVTINDEILEYPSVGVRLKGNTNSRGEICDENGYIISERHLKISFDETFDDEMYETGMPGNPFLVDWSTNTAARKIRKKRTFGGMEKIDLKWNASLDLSKAKQSYALKTFRDNGVIAPHDNVVNFSLGVYSSNDIYIDGYTDTYDMLECIDETFINRYYSIEEQGGDLYKCLSHDSYLADLSNTTTTLIGIEDNYTGFHPTYDLKSNKKTSNMSSMYNYINTISQNTLYRGTATTNIKNKLEATVDIDSFLKTEALSYLMGNPDDQRFNYNNYYIYFGKTSGKAYYIPYDWDWCFGCTYISGNAISYKPFQIETTKQKQNTNALYYRTIISNTSSTLGKSTMYPLISEYRDTFAEYLSTFKNDVLSDAKFEEYLDELTYAGTDIVVTAESDRKQLTTFKSYASQKLAIVNSALVSGGY